MAIGSSKALQLWRRPHLIPPVHADALVQPADTLTAEVPHKARHVFVAKRLPTAAIDSSEKSRILVTGPAIEKENAVNFTTFARLLILGLTCLALSTTFFPQRKSRYLPEVDRDTLRGDELPLDIPFPSKEDLIQKLPALERLALAMRQPVPTGIRRLDIQMTIRESVRQYGLLEPVYLELERRPEYLVLIDASNPLLSQLNRYLGETLTSDGVRINIYFYEEDDVFYQEGTAEPVNGYGLRERLSGARLIVMSTDPSDLLPPGLTH